MWQGYIFTKREREERSLDEGKLQGKSVEKTKDITDNLLGKWIKNVFLKKGARV